MTREQYIEISEEYLNKFHLDAAVTFTGGSIIRKEGSIFSDLDIIAVYSKNNLDEPYRETLVYKGCPIDIFCETTESLNIILDREQEEGHCETMSIIADSIMLPSESPMGKEIHKDVLKRLKKGPKYVRSSENKKMRLNITNNILDLKDIQKKVEKGEDHIIRKAILGRLFEALPIFYLSANRKWRGPDKKYVVLFEKEYPSLAIRYKMVFEAAYQNNAIASELVELADKMLSPFGGFVWQGFTEKLSR